MRPAEVCQLLLLALNPSEGRRKQRKRDTTPDAIGMGLKRQLLEQVVRADPCAEEFEHWLLIQCHTIGKAPGPVLAMAQEILTEWHLAEASAAFRTWLRQGAPSDDAE